MTIPLADLEDIILVSESKSMKYTPWCLSVVVQEARKEAERLKKSGYVPKDQRGYNLFDKPKRKKVSK